MLGIYGAFILLYVKDFFVIKMYTNFAAKKLEKDSIFTTVGHCPPEVKQIHVLYWDLKPSAVKEAVEKGIYEALKNNMSTVIIPVEGL